MKTNLMVFIAGDNDLDTFGTTDIQEMMSVEDTGEKLTILVQQDQSVFARDASTKRYVIRHGIKEETIHLGETNTGEVSTLREFIEWGLEKYPAERKIVVLWNHGGGTRDEEYAKYNNNQTTIENIGRVRLAPSRAVGNATVRAINPEFKSKVQFLNCSYGFRPKRNAHQALNEIDTIIMTQRVSHVVEADIKGFFDNVNHDMLLEFIKIRVKDRSLLLLIEKFLKAGYVDNNLLVKTDKGTPQGSILSPLLANIFLHYVLDSWFNQTVKQHVRGFCELVRYADDFVIMVQYQNEAVRIKKALENRFNRYELTLHPDKTKIFSFGRFERGNSKNQNRKANTFDFLGFTHFCDISMNGYFKVGRKTAMKKFRAKIKELNIWLKQIRNLVPTKEWWQILKAKLRGHFEYFGVSGNSPSIQQFYRLAIKLVHKWLNRRSQKRSMSWSKLYNYLALYPLPKPKIKHNFYTLSHKVVRYIEEPYEGNLQVRFCEGRSATPNYKLNKKEG